MRSFILFVFILVSCTINAQCFEIESILVDACNGSPCPGSATEGENEMVRFQVGPAALNYNNLTVAWPSNPWKGIETSTLITTPIVNTLNSTIVNCGYLKEPAGGILPAGKTVLLITSTNMCTSGNSFANLSDTLYVIFQKAGNTSGHFANYSSTPGLRTLTMTFSTPSSCSDVVTYDISLLVNQSGGYGGTSAQKDGATVEFDPAGNPTYVNYGCQAPYIPLAVDAGPDQTACLGAPAVLTATAQGGYTSLTWSGGTGTFSTPSATTTSYTPGAGETGTIKIYCTVMKPCGTQTLTAKDSMNLNILQLPQATISASNGYSLCPGTSSVLSYTLSSAAFAGTVTPSWSSPASGATTYTVSAGATTTTYTLNLANGCGSTAHTFTIYPLTAPSISLSPATLTACGGSTVSVTANSNSGNYSWSVPAGATTAVVTFTANASATGVVTTTNVCGQASAAYTLTVIQAPTVAITPSSLALCNGQSATLSASSNAAGSYTWSTGANTSSISVNTAGVRTASVSNQCGSASASSTVTVGGSPTIAIVPSPSVICSGQTATLTIAGSVGSYSWSTGVSSNSITVNTAGVYSASVSNSCGSASASVSISAGAGPTVSINPATLTLCNGQSGTLTATGNATNYLWDNFATTNTISVSSSGVRTVTVTGQCGSATASATVTAGQVPSLTVTATSTLVCPNEGVTLTVSGGTMPYDWSHTSSIGATVSAGAGTYSVSSTNACGTGTASITIAQYSINVSFTANPTSGTGPLVVTYTNTSSNSTSYNWFFGNGNSSTAQNPGPQTYNNAGTYTVVLVGHNGNCEGYDTLIVTVLPDHPYLIIPNVFTPNGDLVNDLFHVSGLNISQFHCSVYDRWGIEMFAWDDIKSGWDGTVSGKSASDGTYFYIIRAKDIFDKDITEKGTFLLVR